MVFLLQKSFSFYLLYSYSGFGDNLIDDFFVTSDEYRAANACTVEKDFLDLGYFRDIFERTLVRVHYRIARPPNLYSTFCGIFCKNVFEMCDFQVKSHSNATFVGRRLQTNPTCELTLKHIHLRSHLFARDVGNHLL